MYLLLSQLKFYCNRWQLTANASKTKLQYLAESLKIESAISNFDGKGLELVDEFKCAGAVPKNNGNSDTCRKSLYDQSSKTMYALLFEM